MVFNATFINISVISWQSVLLVDHGYEPCSGQTKDYKIGIRCFSAKHGVLDYKSKDWSTQNQDNVPEWSNVCYFSG